MKAAIPLGVQIGGSTEAARFSSHVNTSPRIPGPDQLAALVDQRRSAGATRFRASSLRPFVPVSLSPQVNIPRMLQAAAAGGVGYRRLSVMPDTSHALPAVNYSGLH